MKLPHGHRRLRRTDILRAGDLVQFTRSCSWGAIHPSNIGRKVGEMTIGPKYCRPALAAEKEEA